MTQLVVAVAIVAVALVVAAIVRRRRPDPPSQPQGTVPAQLDRGEFARPDAPWLVAVFSSATCDTCALVREKARVLESRDVAFSDVEYPAQRALHRRYGIDAVPTLVIVDDQGVVRRSFIGPVTATDLWASLAEVREPGSAPDMADGATPGDGV